MADQVLDQVRDMAEGQIVGDPKHAGLFAVMRPMPSPIPSDC